MNDTPQTTPPASLERLLFLLLPARNHEVITGDLHEAYAEHEQRSGRAGANLWYMQQVLSFAPQALLTGAARARLLTLLCAFTALAGSWLGVMGVLLHHPRPQQLIAATIVAQALLTLAALALYRSPVMRGLAVLGCLAILRLGALAIWGMFHGPDMEGYILLIGLALMLQALLTILRFVRNPTGTALPS